MTPEEKQAALERTRSMSERIHSGIPRQSVLWPECFITGEFEQKGETERDRQLYAIATALEGWGISMLGNKPPENFGIAMAKICMITNCGTPEEFSRKGKELMAKLEAQG